MQRLKLRLGLLKVESNLGMLAGPICGTDNSIWGHADSRRVLVKRDDPEGEIYSGCGTYADPHREQTYQTARSAYQRIATEGRPS